MHATNVFDLQSLISNLQSEIPSPPSLWYTQSEKKRQGRGWAIGGAILLFVLLKVLGITDAILLRSRPEAPALWIAGLAWAIPLGTAAFSLDFIFGGPLPALAPAILRRLRKLSRGP